MLKTKMRSCYASATTGIPPMDQLFNVSLCSSDSKVFAQLLTGIKGEADTLEATSPIVLESSRSSTFLSDHPTHDLDTIFLVSNGKMSSYRPNGRLNWQIDTEATWTKVRTKASQHSMGSSQSFTASLLPFLLDPFGDQKAILAVGRSIVLVSPTGDILASVSLEGQIPVTSPTIGDFNNDGLDDIIVTTATGYTGFVVLNGRSSLGLLVPLLIVVILAAIGFFTLSKNAPKQVHSEVERDRRKIS